MTHKISLILAGLLLGAMVVMAGVLLAVGERSALATSPSATTLDIATTTASFAVTSSARVLATTTNPVGYPGITSFTRVYATICNANANPVALLMDRDEQANLSTGKVTVWIAAAAGYNACYEITDRNLYQGSVQASSTNQTSTTITVADYVQ